jgi:hypothetical protein
LVRVLKNVAIDVEKMLLVSDRQDSKPFAPEQGQPTCVASGVPYLRFQGADDRSFPNCRKHHLWRRLAIVALNMLSMAPSAKSSGVTIKPGAIPGEDEMSPSESGVG